MNKYILIRHDIVLSFKGKVSMEKYIVRAALRGETYIQVKILSNGYQIFNPYLVGDKVRLVYSFNEVLKICGDF